jgi:hypothetical protein
MASKILKSEGDEHDSSKKPVSSVFNDLSHLIEHSDSELTLSKCSQSTFKTLFSRHQISVGSRDKVDLSLNGNSPEPDNLYVGKR